MDCCDRRNEGYVNKVAVPLLSGPREPSRGEATKRSLNPPPLSADTTSSKCSGSVRGFTRSREGFPAADWVFQNCRLFDWVKTLPDLTFDDRWSLSNPSN